MTGECLHILWSNQPQTNSPAHDISVSCLRCSGAVLTMSFSGQVTLLAPSRIAVGRELFSRLQIDSKLNIWTCRPFLQIMSDVSSYYWIKPANGVWSTCDNLIDVTLFLNKVSAKWLCSFYFTCDVVAFTNIIYR